MTNSLHFSAFVAISCGQVAAVSLAVAIIVVAIILVVVGAKHPESFKPPAKTPYPSSGWFVLAAILITLLCGYLVFYIVTTNGINANDEVVTGLLVVASVAALMTLLFCMAAGFKSLDLADVKQALGLPEGSVRAMIALILILVFIIFGIYTFRLVGNGTSVLLETVGKQPELKELADLKSADKEARAVFAQANGPGKWDIWVYHGLGADAARLAQQLITTVGTLVVAISSFYFGASSTTSAVNASKLKNEEPVLKVEGNHPTEGPTNQPIDIDIFGSGFKGKVAVSLERGTETLTADASIAIGEGKIRSKFSLPRPAGGAPWDLVVTLQDGNRDRLPQAFKIT